MTKRQKKNTLLRIIIPVAIAALLAGLGFRFARRWKIPVFRAAPGLTPRQSAERFRRKVLALSDSSFTVRTAVRDSLPGLAITDRRGRPFVMTNLSLLRQAEACGIGLLSAAEDRKHQALELVYGLPDRPLLAIAIRKMKSVAAEPPAAGPRIALVAYGVSGADKVARAALSRRPEIRALIVDRPMTAAGRELLVSLPLEPIGYPKEDPGPGTILLDDSESRIGAKLLQRRKIVPAPAGFAAEAGSRALKDKRITALIARFCADNRLIFLEPRFTANSLAREQAAASGCPYLTATVYIDKNAPLRSVETQIQSAFQHARRDKVALLMLPARADVLSALGKALTREVLSEFEFVGVTKLVK